MITYFRMKKNEWKVKAELYKLASDFIDNKREFCNLVKNLYDRLKDIPLDELRNEYIKCLVEVIHKETHNGNEWNGSFKAQIT